MSVLSRFWLLGLGLVAHLAAAQSQSSCQAVYSDSVRNVDTYTRVLSEQNDTFNRHCEANGSVKSSSTSADMTIPIKGIMVGFSGTRDEAAQRMQNFCKTHAASLSRYESTYQLSNKVVVDALSSFNQCIQLEGKRIAISHVQTDARSLVVRVSMNPATDVLTLNSVAFDPRVATCRTNISGEGSLRTLGPDYTQVTAKGPFSIACDRIPTRNAAGDEFYPRIELLVDTSQGAYTVAMPTEGLYGYDTANATRQRILADAQEKAALSQQVSTLTRKLEKPVIVMQGATQGEKRGAQVPCPQNGGDVAKYAAQVCKGILSPLRHVASTNGNRCGYNSYVWSCTTYPD